MHKTGKWIVEKNCRKRRYERIQTNGVCLQTKRVSTFKFCLSLIWAPGLLQQRDGIVCNLKSVFPQLTGGCTGIQN